MIDLLIVQFVSFASLTITVCDVAFSPVNVFGEVALAKAPPSIFAWYEPEPPLNVAVTVPFDPPLQVTSVFVRSSVSAGG